MAAAKFGPCKAEIEARDILKRSPRRGKLRVELTFTLENLIVTDMTTNVSANSGSFVITQYSSTVYNRDCYGLSALSPYLRKIQILLSV